MPAKNTLTAADAKILEERFQARLSAIGDTRTMTGPLRDLHSVGQLMALPLPSDLMLSLSKPQ
jgi:hypothetical protein